MVESNLPQLAKYSGQDNLAQQLALLTAASTGPDYTTIAFSPVRLLFCSGSGITYFSCHSQVRAIEWEAALLKELETAAASDTSVFKDLAPQTFKQLGELLRDYSEEK